MLVVLAVVPVFLYAQASEGMHAIEHTHEEHSHAGHTHEKTFVQPGDIDTTVIYQGMSLKLDIGNTILEAATSKGKIISTEVAMNWRLKKRYIPTLELGYCQMSPYQDEKQQWSYGGFGRIGMDLNPMRKHPERENMLLLGLRVGTALQSYELTDRIKHFGADAWGEVVAGCQVQVIKGFQMGWYVRLKVLFTRQKSADDIRALYIPGFGYRDDMGWGLNYYVGYRF